MKKYLALIILVMMMLVPSTTFADNDLVWTRSSTAFTYRWVSFDKMLAESAEFKSVNKDHSKLDNLAYSVSGHTGFMADSGDRVTGDYRFTEGKYTFLNKYTALTSDVTSALFQTSVNDTGTNHLRVLSIKGVNYSGLSGTGGSLTSLNVYSEHAGQGATSEWYGINVELNDTYTGSSRDPSTTERAGLKVVANHSSDTAWADDLYNVKSVINTTDQIICGPFTTTYYSEFNGTTASRPFVHTPSNYLAIMNLEADTSISGYARPACFYGIMQGSGNSYHFGAYIQDETASDINAWGVYVDMGTSDTGGNKYSGVFEGQPLLVGAPNAGITHAENSGDLYVMNNTEIDGDLYLEGDLITDTIPGQPFEIVHGGVGQASGRCYSEIPLPLFGDPDGTFTIESVRLYFEDAVQSKAVTELSVDEFTIGQDISPTSTNRLYRWAAQDVNDYATIINAETDAACIDTGTETRFPIYGDVAPFAHHEGQYVYVFGNLISSDQDKRCLTFVDTWAADALQVLPLTGDVHEYPANTSITYSDNLVKDATGVDIDFATFGSNVLSIIIETNYDISAANPFIEVRGYAR